MKEVPIILSSNKNYLKNGLTLELINPLQMKTRMGLKILMNGDGQTMEIIQVKQIKIKQTLKTQFRIVLPQIKVLI